MSGNFQIEDWEVQPQLNRLCRGDKSVHVEPKVMQVLVQLANQAGEVLSKEQLFHTVWSDTFVGDEVLTRCISEIRRVLEDDARAPRFVQTIPKVGYRLIARVVRQDVPVAQRQNARPGNGSGSTVAVLDAPKLDAPELPRSVPSVLRPASRNWLPWVVILLLVAAMGAAGTWAVLRRAPRTTAADFRTLPLTSYAGSQTQPAFSPDSNKVAFVWNGENGDRLSIYLKMIGTENPVRLTSGPGNDFSPVWSPDGGFIAFLRTDAEERGVFIQSSIGGPARKVAPLTGTTDSSRASLTWSPDGKSLIFTDGRSAQSPSALFLLNLETLNVRKLTSPSHSWDGDYSPVYSPDGKNIALIRDTEASVRDVYIMAAEGGEPRRLTFDNRQVSGVAWSADGTDVVFSSNRAGKFALWRVPVKGGTPERLPVGTEDAYFPSIAPKGNRLAYAQTAAQWNIMRVELDAAGKAQTTRLLSSAAQDSAPRYSPDGSRIAFQSWRSGTQEIWVCAGNGSGPTQLTSFNGPLTGSPSWSADGRQIAFDSRPEGRSHIYTISADGGVPRKITSGDQNDILPSWSRDMKSIYFASNRSGAWEIWKVNANGGQATQITHVGGFLGMETFDGQWLYYTKADISGLWRISTSGGAEEPVLTQPKSGYWGYLSMTQDGIYYLDATNTPPSINFLDPASKRTRRVYTLPRMPSVYNGLSVAGNGRSWVYTDSTDAVSHITLVEHFR